MFFVERGRYSLIDQNVLPTPSQNNSVINTCNLFVALSAIGYQRLNASDVTNIIRQVAVNSSDVDTRPQAPGLTRPQVNNFEHDERERQGGTQSSIESELQVVPQLLVAPELQTHCRRHNKLYS